LFPLRTVASIKISGGKTYDFVERMRKKDDTECIKVAGKFPGPLLSLFVSVGMKKGARRGSKEGQNGGGT